MKDSIMVSADPMVEVFAAMHRLSASVHDLRDAEGNPLDPDKWYAYLGYGSPDKIRICTRGWDSLAIAKIKAHEKLHLPSDAFGYARGRHFLDPNGLMYATSLEPKKPVRSASANEILDLEGNPLDPDKWYAYHYTGSHPPVKILTSGARSLPAARTLVQELKEAPRLPVNYATGAGLMSRFKVRSGNTLVSESGNFLHHIVGKAFNQYRDLYWERMSDNDQDRLVRFATAIEEALRTDYGVTAQALRQNNLNFETRHGDFWLVFNAEAFRPTSNQPSHTDTVALIDSMQAKDDAFQKTRKTLVTALATSFRKRKLDRDPGKPCAAQRNWAGFSASSGGAELGLFYLSFRRSLPL